MSAFKDGNRPPGLTPNDPFIAPHDVPPTIAKNRAQKALEEGAGLDPIADFDGRAEAYEAHWKEGDKVND